MHRSADREWTITDVAFPFFNNIFNARLPDEDIESTIEEALEPFRQRKVPAFWWTGPATRPVDLGRHLERAGLEHGFEAPAMAVDLDAMNGACSPPSGLVVEEVVEEDGLRQWCDVMTPIYQFPDIAAGPWFKMLASLGLSPDKPLRHFMARLDRRPVATISLYFGRGRGGDFECRHVARLSAPGHWDGANGGRVSRGETCGLSDRRPVFLGDGAPHVQADRVPGVWERELLRLVTLLADLTEAGEVFVDLSFGRSGRRR